MKALFETRCGCTKVGEVPFPPPPYWLVPLPLPPVQIKIGPNFSIIAQKPEDIDIRRFHLVTHPICSADLVYYKEEA